MFELDGAIAAAPMKRTGWLSVNGVQFAPPSRVRQTPPPASATKILLTLAGSAVMPVMRPVTGRLPGVCPLLIGAGPIGVQVVAFSGMLVDKSVRSSSNSRKSFFLDRNHWCRRTAG